ncbi:MAG: TonB-dependent receptor domain-containing protein [bacterium]
MLVWAGIAAAQEHAHLLISGNYQSTPLKEILIELEQKLHLTFSYIDQLVDGVFITASFRDKKLAEALAIILKDTPLSFRMKDANNIILFRATEQPLKKYSLHGTVIDRQTRAPLPYVNVIVRGFLKGDASDSSGFYKIERLEPGLYQIDFEMLGYKKSSHRIKLVEDTELAVALVQQPVELEAIEISPAVIEISAEEPAMHVLGSEEILSSTNFQKDVYRSMQMLPGISNTDFSVKPHIKGGNPDETAVFLDNMPIYEPFHLEDLNDGAYSIISTEQVRHLKLLTGGFSAKYAERMSGVIDIKTFDSIKEHAFNFTLDYLFLSTFFNKQITDRVNYFVSARRTTFDWLHRDALFRVDLALASEIGSQTEMSTVEKIAPVNFDFWSKLNYRVNPSHHLSFNVLFAADDMGTVEGLSYFRPEFAKSSRRNAYGWVNWNWLASKRFSSINTMGFQRLSKRAEFSLGLNVLDVTHRWNYDDQLSDIFTFRQQNLWQLSEDHMLELGLEVNHFRGQYFYDDLRLDRLRTAEESAVFDTLYVKTKISGHTLAGYLQDTWKISNRLGLLVGMRISDQNYTGKPQFAPRSALKINFTEHLRLKLAYCWYYQPDNFYKLKTYLGATELNPKPEKSIHYVGGLSFARENLSVDLGAYFKDYAQLNDDFQFDIHNRIESVGIVDVPFSTRRGTSAGAEIFIRANYAKDNLVSLAYALSKNRVTNDLGKTVPRDFDRTHALNVNSIFKFAHDWTIGVLWRFHTGDPFTPASIHVLGDSTRDNFLNYVYFTTGAKNSARYPAYHTLDLKIQKEWGIKKIKLAAYLSILNVYNRKNLREIDFGLSNAKLISHFTKEQRFFERLFAPGMSVIF